MAFFQCDFFSTALCFNTSVNIIIPTAGATEAGADGLPEGRIQRVEAAVQLDSRVERILAAPKRRDAVASPKEARRHAAIELQREVGIGCGGEAARAGLADGENASPRAGLATSPLAAFVAGEAASPPAGFAAREEATSPLMPAPPGRCSPASRRSCARR